MVTIYALLDPRDNQIRYIGKAKNLKKRVIEHLKLRERTYKNNWLKSIVALGLKPKVKVLEIVNDDDWQDKERYYIKYYKDLGCRLTNMTEGGEGIDFTDVIRQKISKANKGRKPSRKAIENSIRTNRGRKLTKLHRLKISKKLKGIKRSKSVCEKQRQRMLGKKWSEESRIKLSKSKKGFVWKEESKDKLKRAILQFDKEDNFIREISGLTDAAKKFNGEKANIWRCLNKQRKTAYGYKWRYKT